MSASSPRREVRVRLDKRSYSVLVGSGLLADCGRLLIDSLDGASEVVVVSNPVVAGLYGGAVTDSLAGAGLKVSTVELPDGEESKTLASVETIYDAVLDLGGDRSVVVVALGGGVVGDVAGFAAASVLRGVRSVVMPTTLLAQVDASVGGKTGVNRRQGKNLVGAFHQPSLVLADIDSLATLPDREFRAGLAEVVKYGVILDASLFDLLEENGDAIIRRDEGLLAEIVARSVALKAAVVEEDETETSGHRAILNFGHTVGHALEKVTSYSNLLHGEAVAIGMVAAARVSASRGACGAEVAERLVALLVSFGLETEIPGSIDRPRLREAISFDKKRQGDLVTFIVSERIGACRLEPLSPAAIVDAC